MKISHFKIQNVKGINYLNLDLNTQPTSKVFTLVGLNESGKTTILEAIDLLQHHVKLDYRHTLIPKGKKNNFNGSVSVTAKYIWTEKDNEQLKRFVLTLGFTNVNNIQNHTLEKSYNFVNSTSVEKEINNIWGISLIVSKKRSKKDILLSHKDKEWHVIIDYIKENLKPNIVYYPNFLFDFPEKIYIEKKENSNYEDSRYIDVIQDILHYIDSSLSVEKHLLYRMKNLSRANKESLESTLGHMSSTVTQVVFSAWGRLFSKGSKEIIVTYDSDLDDEGNEKFFLEFKLREGPNRFNINERSLGFKWFFAFLLFTEFRRNRRSDSGETLFLLDEPASNLHSTAQKNLLTTFKDLVVKSSLIYTTHSHHLINPEWLAGTYIVRNKALDYQDEFAYESTQTDVEAVPYRQFIAKYPTQVDYFQPILDTLDYQPGLIEKIPKIIITEGKNDYYTFKYINKIYLNSYYELSNIFPGTGADTNRPVMSLYLSWGREFILLLDADKKGIDAKKRYINDLGIDVKDRIITLADIDTNWMGKSTEELFSTEELILITKKFDPSSNKYDKSRFNTAIQTLLSEEERVDISDETLGNFKKLFSTLQNKLAAVHY